MGEFDSITGKIPFKPYDGISKAEGIKVILEALDTKRIIDLPAMNVKDGEAWYVPYVKVAKDLTPYLIKKGELREHFIITNSESQNLDDKLTRGEFIAMADRVLTVYDCSAIDSDKDGMPDYYENLHHLNPNDPKDADLDPDKDGLVNLSEYRHGTDPFDPDTDDGGVNDGTEVLKGTNPRNNPKDDPIDSDNDGLTDSMEINIFNTDPFDPDTDDGGVDDGTEVNFNSTNPNDPKDDLDSDEDGLSDFSEINIYKTDPFDSDTDDGGVNDGTEVYRGTDPLFKDDDLIDPRSDLDEGIYVVLPKCFTCPCAISIEHSADLIDGDKVFAVISNDDNDKIFAKSNVIDITQVKE